jgi:phosphohistidine phosphatase
MIMDLILWRHAEAEPGEPDLARALTRKGFRQAGTVAEWLTSNLPENCRILVSPAKRTLQTVEALDRKFQVHPGLAPDAAAEDVLSIVQWPDQREPVMIVGHQPTLGQVAALLIAGTEQNWLIRKSGVCWIAQREREGVLTNYLKTVISPDLTYR